MRGFALIICLFALIVALAMPDLPSEAAAGEAGGVEVNHVAAPAAPASAPPAAPANIHGAVAFERGPGGHFWTLADVGGTSVRFLVDTGATGVVLTEADARRAGIVLDPQRYRVVGRQVSGEVRGQFVTLPSVRVGDKRVTDVAGIVVEGARESLLGQSFLTRAGRIEMEGGRMLLR
ncbi:retropepsin-like aspartic protease family protein [Sphingomicrobium astaxanthinifaciens]|uniref:retropepsin-like aspartic protease family protein n=1 Tax=Sphingomicrobium astaxanthinifaciens TaxID=1227949 RepID=UPI001FCC306D|nr:TIGR02281 family clan AA aspartic protease [Sphingomicrobium astaxanthinifaciens]MCJ7421089.1 TIGR02281 family clan AA aspartic protease [Sphingomicrobium astaxanthinifaciens]